MTPISPMVEGTSSAAKEDPYFYGWRYVEGKREDGTSFTKQVPLTEWDVLHPQEDDFIVTNELHVKTCLYLTTIFEWWLADRPGAKVHCDHRIDWQGEGILPHGPDISVFFDSAPWDPLRGTYPMRDMGARPVCVVEVTSPSTHSGDFGDKIVEYCAAGVPIYVIIDLLEDDGRPDIHLYAYQPSRQGPVQILEPGANRVWLPGVDLWIGIDGEQIVCLDPKGNPIGNYNEVAGLLEEVKKQAQDEKQRADLAEKSAQDEKRLAQDEKQRADLAEKSAQDAKQRADESERRLKELEAELQKLRGHAP